VHCYSNHMTVFGIILDDVATSTTTVTTSVTIHSTEATTSSSLSTATPASRVDALLSEAQEVEDEALSAVLSGANGSYAIETPSVAVAVVTLNSSAAQAVTVETEDGVRVTATIPIEALQLAFAGVNETNASGDVSVAFAVITVFKGNGTDTLTTQVGGQGTDITVASLPISIKLYGSDGEEVSVSGLDTAISITLPLADSNQSLTEIRCAYLDEAEVLWRFDGLERTDAGNDESFIVCATSHLTIFAAILDSTLATLQCANVKVFQPSSWRKLWEMIWLPTFGGVLLFAVVILEIAAMVRASLAHTPGWSDDVLLTDNEVARRAMVSNTASSKKIDRLLEQFGVSGWAEVWATARSYLHATDLMFKMKEHLACKVLAYEEGIHFLDLTQVRDMQRLYTRRRSGSQASLDSTDRLTLSSNEEADVRDKPSKLLTREGSFPSHHSEIATDDSSHSEKFSEYMGQADSGNGDELTRQLVSTLDPANVRATSFRARIQDIDTDSVSNSHEVGRLLLSMPVMDHANLAIQQFAKASSFTQVKILFCMSCEWLTLQSFSFSRSPQSRCLLQILRLNGAIAVAALVLESAFGSVSADSDVDCELSTVWERIGRNIAVCLLSILVGGFPCLVMGFLSNKSFVYDNSWDEEKRQRKLYKWWLKIILIWSVSTIYNAFCMIYLALFLANVGNAGNLDFTVMSFFSVMLELLFFPLLTAFPLLVFVRSPQFARLCGPSRQSKHQMDRLAAAPVDAPTSPSSSSSFIAVDIDAEGLNNDDGSEEDEWVWSDEEEVVGSIHESFIGSFFDPDNASNEFPPDVVEPLDWVPFDPDVPSTGLPESGSDMESEELRRELSHPDSFVLDLDRDAPSIEASKSKGAALRSAAGVCGVEVEWAVML